MELVYFEVSASEDEITQPPRTTVGQVDSERSVSILYILNHLQYPLKFQRDCASQEISAVLCFSLFVSHIRGNSKKAD
jgi:hypothetical protein